MIEEIAEFVFETVLEMGAHFATPRLGGSREHPGNEILGLNLNGQHRIQPRVGSELAGVINPFRRKLAIWAWVLLLLGGACGAFTPPSALGAIRILSLIVIVLAMILAFFARGFLAGKIAMLGALISGGTVFWLTRSHLP